MSACVFPFPIVTASAADARSRLWLRRFGERLTDLEIDLRHDDGRDAATAVLTSCCLDGNGDAADVETLRDLPLADRLAALLTLAAHVDDRELETTLRCHSCGEQLEAPLPAHEIIDYAATRTAPAGHVRVELPERVLLLRLPTARDLARWSESGASAEQMVNSLCSEPAQLPPTLPRQWLELIERALGEADPLVDFRLAIDCPECDAHASYDIDLQALALRRLAKARRELLATVHRLASVYHWSEGDIMALPPSRRRQYLALIEAER